MSSDQAAVKFSVRPDQLLFDGTIGRIARMCSVLILTVWIAYDNVLELAYVYLLPVLSAIAMALYPMNMASTLLTWLLIAPYTLLKLVYACTLCTLVSHLIDSRGWTETQVRWIPLGWYAITLLVICQARASYSNKTCYTILLAGQYVFFLVFFPLYLLATKGMLFVTDAKMIAVLRALILQAEKLPGLPELFISFLQSLAHPQCDHLFVQTPDFDAGDAAIYPNQSCRVPVPLFVRVIGGIFEASRSHEMTVTTDANAQFINFNYRPGSEFFFDTAWYLRGSQGIFRGMWLAQLIALIIFTLTVLIKPNTRTKYLLKNKLVDFQRRLYKTGALLMESAQIIGGQERVQEKICLIPTAQGKASFGRTAVGNHFISKYAPSSDLDNLHSRILDLTPLVNFCHLESAISQSPGIQSAPALKGLQTTLIHEAVMMSALARAFAQTGTIDQELTQVAGEDRVYWYHPIAQQLRDGRCQIVRLGADNRVCSADLAQMKNIFISYFRISQLVERSLSVDEIWARDSPMLELLQELRHALQIEMSAMMSYISMYTRNISAESALIDHVILTFGYTSIEKCKSCILYLEGETQKSCGTYITSVLIAVLGPVMVYVKGVLSGWKNVFRAHKRHINSCPMKNYHEVDLCQSFTLAKNYSKASYKSKNGQRPILHNVELWAGFRYFIGDLLIFSVFLFKIDDWSQVNFTSTQKKHMTSRKILGDSLSLSDEVIRIVSALVKPSNDGSGMGDNIEIIPKLLWADAALFKISKLVGWTFLGYLCSNLVTYQGTIKRTCIRFSAMLLSTLLAWLVLFVAMNQLSTASGDEPFAADTVSAFALENQTLRYWMYVIATAIGCMLIALSVTFFSNPFGRRYGFDPQFGYFGQIITYHFLVITFGLLGDVRQTRDELCICRILGHLIGSCISVVLTLAFFPTDANKQHLIRISNMTVTARRSFIALTYTILHNMNADGNSAKPTREEWRKYLEEQLTVWSVEIEAFQSTFEDASIGDSCNLLENNHIFSELADIMKNKYYQRTAVIRAIDNEQEGPSKIYEKDATFGEWVGTNSPVADKQEATLHKDHSELCRMRLRYAGHQLVRPISPYPFFEDDSSSEEISGRQHSPFSARRLAPPNLESAPSPLSVSTRLDGPSLANLSSPMTFGQDPEPENQAVGSVSVTSLAEDLNILQVLWISVEQALENLRRKNFDRIGWNRYTSDLIDQLQTSLLRKFELTRPLDWPSHVLFKIWNDELTAIRRIIGYINEYSGDPTRTKP